MNRHVYLFNPQFAPAVSNGLSMLAGSPDYDPSAPVKLQTIRPMRKRMPKPGHLIDARQWSGRPYCSPQVKLGPLVQCCRVSYVWIYASGPIYIDEVLLMPESADAFAIADGFSDHAAMLAWFQRTHDLPFHGFLTMWG